MEKLLLYCTKAKPLLAYFGNNLNLYHFFKIDRRSMTFAFDDERLNEENLSYILNGTIVAECECDLVEEIKFISYNCIYYTNTLDTFNNKLFQKSCLDYWDLDEYLKQKRGYALHLKNLKIFDKPLELKDTYTRECTWDKCSRCAYGKNGKINCCTIDIPLSRAPQNMMWVWYKGERYVLISIKPKWLCKILNG